MLINYWKFKFLLFADTVIYDLLSFFAESRRMKSYFDKRETFFRKAPIAVIQLRKFQFCEGSFSTEFATGKSLEKLNEERAAWSFQYYLELVLAIRN